MIYFQHIHQSNNENLQIFLKEDSAPPPLTLMVHVQPHFLDIILLCHFLCHPRIIEYIYIERERERERDCSHREPFWNSEWVTFCGRQFIEFTDILVKVATSKSFPLTTVLKRNNIIVLVFFPLWFLYSW